MAQVLVLELDDEGKSCSLRVQSLCRRAKHCSRLSEISAHDDAGVPAGGDDEEGDDDDEDEDGTSKVTAGGTATKKRRSTGAQSGAS